MLLFLCPFHLFAHKQVNATCGFRITPTLLLDVIIGFNEVLKVGGIQKRQVIQQLEFSRAKALASHSFAAKTLTCTKTTPPAMQAAKSSAVKAGISGTQKEAGAADEEEGIGTSSEPDNRMTGLVYRTF